MHYGIIAAGEGSRLAQEGVEYPKPLVRLNGVPMIERLIRMFDSLGAESISVIVNEQMTEVQQYVQQLMPSVNAPLGMVVKSTPSSMHSFFELSSLLEGKGKFILTTVDTIFRQDDFARYVKAFDAAPADTDAMMALTPYIDDEKPLYVATAPDMRITAFLDTKEPEVRFVSGGIYGLTTPCVNVLKKCMAEGVSRMRNYQRALISNGLMVRGFDMGKIIDVDHASDIKTAEQFLSEK